MRGAGGGACKPRTQSLQLKLQLERRTLELFLKAAAVGHRLPVEERSCSRPVANPVVPMVCDKRMLVQVNNKIWSGKNRHRASRTGPVAAKGPISVDAAPEPAAMGTFLRGLT